MTIAYALCGLRVASDVELPELMPWTGPADRPADLVFRLGDVPDALDSPDAVLGPFQARGAALCLLSIAGTARFLVRDGREVVMDPAPGGPVADTRAFLTGPVQGLLWHQRGLLPLHAGAVLTRNGALAVTGPSGIGKSTLTAALGARGCPILTDDVCVVDQAADAPPRVLPAHPRLRLWQDAAEALGLDTAGLPRALTGKDKFLVDRRNGFPDGPVPLAAVVQIHRADGAAPRLERLRGHEAVTALSANIHVPRLAAAMGLSPRLFLAASRLAAAVPVHRLTVPPDLAGLDETVDALLGAAAHFSQGLPL